MKPYTLRFWLHLHYRAAIKGCYSDELKEMVRYDLLAIWIEERIIKKYGESE